MAATALLVISNVKQFSKSLTAVERYVSETIYIHLNIPKEKIQPIPSWGRLISQLYGSCPDRGNHGATDSNLNTHILISPLKRQSLCGPHLEHLKRIDMIFADYETPEAVEVCNKLRIQLNVPSNQTIYLAEISKDNVFDWNTLQSLSGESNKQYETVVCGGTFDRIHIGHKIFLTQAVLRACRRLVVGVTTPLLTKSKVLNELILPVEDRIREVREFLQQIDSTLVYDVVPIDDPFGPTQHDPDMDMIMVSDETLRGGEKVNELRIKKNLRPLEIFCIPLVEVEPTETEACVKEAKVSSSNTRIDLLGTRLRQPEARPHLPSKPYIIGLTGGIAAGKSRMATYIRAMGADTLNCDLLAHEVYEPGQPAHAEIVKHFGNEILAADGRIDRTKLGPIVFADKKQLDVLNSIVWPELILVVKKHIDEMRQRRNPPSVVVIEAAVLLTAGWERECHEVWSLIVPPEEAVKRIMTRNGLSEEEARKRCASQLGNNEVVARSNVVFSSQWDEEFTNRQADRAWHILMRELEQRKLIIHPKTTTPNSNL